MALPHAHVRARVLALVLAVRRGWLDRRRLAALRTLGRGLAGAGLRAVDPDVARLVGQVAANLDEGRSLTLALDSSLTSDRRDYSRVTSPFHAAVILRGLLDRVVLRHRRSLSEKSGREAATALGLFAVAKPQSLPSLSPELAATLQHATTLERRFQSLGDALRGHLEPVGGQLFPGWMRAVARELGGVSAVIAREVTSRWIPKVSALGGLAAGWWVARSYTTSRWDSLLNDFGFYKGSAKVVSRAEYERMEFWLPLIAGAICSYAAARIVGAIRRRYAPTPELPANADALDSTSATQISPQ